MPAINLIEALRHVPDSRRSHVEKIDRKNVNLRLSTELFAKFQQRVGAAGKSASRAIEELMRAAVDEK